MDVKFLDLVYSVNSPSSISVVFNHGKEYIDNIRFMYEDIINSMGGSIEIKDDKLIFSNSKALKEFFCHISPEIDYRIIELTVVSNELNFLLE